jgi:hypothetical protein
LAGGNLKFESLKSKRNMKTLIIILFTSLAIFAQEVDSTLIKYENKIAECDKAIQQTASTMYDNILDKEKVAVLALHARDWQIQKEIWIEAKRIYLERRKK